MVLKMKFLMQLKNYLEIKKLMKVILIIICIQKKYQILTY